MKDRSSNRLRIEPLVQMGMPKTVKELLENSVKFNGDKDCILEIKNKEVVHHTFFELKDDIAAIGTALQDMGLKDTHIAVLGETSYEWIATYLAVITGVGVAVPLDKELPPKALAEIINKSDSKTIAFSAAYKDEINAIKDICPNVENYILINAPAENGFISIFDLIEQGKKSIENGNTAYFDKQDDPDDVCLIIYTSGTTGPNKGVMLTHKNICKNAFDSAVYIPGESLCFMTLPNNHVYELNVNLITNLYEGICLCIGTGLKNLIRDLNIYKPEEMIVVPLYVEMFYKIIWDQAKATGKAEELKAKLAESAKLLAQGIDKTQELFQEQRAIFGGRLCEMISGGAPINPTVAQHMSLMGFDIYNGYGITECSPVVSVNMNTATDSLSAGKAYPDTKVKIAYPDENGIGEICVLGDIVMKGYYKDDEATKSSFDEDGYFKTGDYGRFDENGNLFITGRKKNLIILSNGKNVHPEEIESVVVSKMPLARESICYSKANKTLTGEVEMINFTVFIENLTEEMKQAVIAGVKAANQDLPEFKRVGAVVFADDHLPTTTTRKIRRQQVIDAHEQFTNIVLL